MRLKTVLLSLLLALVLGPALAVAQSPVGGLSGKANPGDVAVIRNVDTGFTREITVKKSGKYHLRNLSNGTFEVVIRHPDGTKEAPCRVDVHIGVTSQVKCPAP